MDQFDRLLAIGITAYHHQPGIGDMFRAAAQGTLSDGGMPGGGGRGGTVAMPRRQE